MTSAERRPLLDSYVRQRSLYPYLKQVVSAKGSKISLTLYCLVTGIVSAVRPFIPPRPPTEAHT